MTQNVWKTKFGKDLNNKEDLKTWRDDYDRRQNI